ncbi:NAD(P)/FAD-dependent oxidoreductase [Inhella proteolytica]|uniref:FAD-binding oxidoreductase n=1 Tax=Inhella proteolytica TaxID=2795029 RepID=A0A931J7T2_9BURK|nr:FAD-dependent oxidoreductase [Inhella proteolytica]MBH9577927.1 FAD-binding oxidoreductase [Inhella proteolytica]
MNTTLPSFEFVVVGGGIAGVAVASELAAHGRVLLIEREASLAYHTTGRSAAISMESYGNELIRQLTGASRAFFHEPDPAFTSEPLWAPRGALIVGDELNLAKLRQRHAAVRRQVPQAEWLEGAELRRHLPFLGPQWVAGILEPSAFDLDVHAIHSAFRRRLRQLGGQVRAGTELLAAHQDGGGWSLQLSDGSHVAAGSIVNAAGAWADELARRCGVRPLGLRPLLRTVVVVDPECEVSGCPYLGTVDEQLFIKPEVGRLLVSPCDETPSEPCDALPDELGVAIAMERLLRATQLRPRRVLNRWAGLRVFVPDRSPVIGVDPEKDGFVWCAALGGYGIQTAPAVARLCAALTRGAALHAELQGLDPKQTSPVRLHARSRECLLAVADLH